MLIPLHQEEDTGWPEVQEKGSWVGVPMRTFPVVRELNTTEERHHDQRYFQEEITEIKIAVPKNCPGFHCW
jgi:hypothetical protein